MQRSFLGALRNSAGGSRKGAVQLLALALGLGSQCIAQTTRPTFSNASDGAGAFARRFYLIAQRGSSAEFSRLWAPAKSASAIRERREQLRRLLIEPPSELRPEVCDVLSESRQFVVRLRFRSNPLDVHAPCHRLTLALIGGSFRAIRESSPAESTAASILAAVSCRNADLPTALDCPQFKDAGSAELARAFATIGDSEARADHTEEAMRAYRFSQNAARQIGDVRAQVAAILSLASLQISNNKYAEAQTLLVESAHLAEENHDPLALARTQIQQGRLFYFQSKYKPAIDLYRLAFEAARNASSPKDVAAAGINLGAVEMDAGLYTAASEDLQTARENAAIDGGQEYLASSFHNSGDMELEFGNPEAALGYYKKSLAIKRQLGNRKKICTTLDSIGVAYITIKNHKRALAFLAEAEGFASDDAAKAYIYDHQGSAYAGLGEFSKAATLHSKSIVFGDKAHETSITGAAEINLAEALSKQHDSTGALEHFRKGEAIARAIGAQPVAWQALANMAKLYQEGGDRLNAERSAQGAISLIESLRDQIPGGVLPRQDFFENKLAPYGLMMESVLSRKDPAGALRFAEQARARSLLDTVQARRQKITSEMSVPEIRQEEMLDLELRSAEGELAAALADEKPDQKGVEQVRARSDAAREQLKAFERELYKAKPDLEAQRGLAQWSPDGFSSLLASDMAIVEYALLGSRPYVFVIKKNGNALAVSCHALPISSAGLAEKVHSFRSLLAARSGGFRAQAASLFRNLVQPAQQDLAGKKTVLIIPDGVLWELPFQALLHNDRFWIEDVAIAYVPSLAVLQAASSSSTASGSDGKLETATQMPRLFAIFNPAGPRYNRYLAANKLGALPDALEPIRSLRQLYNNSASDIVTGTLGSERRFRQSAGRYDVYHFMTHSILDDRSPLHSAILLAGEGSREDGRLEAREIMDLRLGADLAVLSACKTLGQRVTPGEGLLGMSWAFFVAGTSNVVASQWLVDGRATNDLMVLFHRELLAETHWRGSVLPKARALQKASLKMLRGDSYAHPFYWASFQAFGTRL